MIEFTHKGWFWFCPIYLRLDSEDEATVEARWAWMEPLFSLAELFEESRIFLSSLLIEDYEPTFMFTITGELKK